MSDNIMDLEMLTPGSVWLRPNGKQSRYLFTTNITVPTKHQKDHPQMVVFADEEDNIYSVEVDDFLSKRSFFNIDPALEQRLDNLLAYSDDTGTEDFSLNDEEDTLLIADEEVEEETNQRGLTAVTQHVDSAGYVEEQINPFPVDYYAAPTDKPALISAERLATITECYQQQPLVASNKLQHVLYMRAVPDAPMSVLNASFNPSNVDKNAVYMFRVNTPEGVLEIDWNEMVGVYPYIFRNEPMYQIIFQSDIEFDYAQDPVVEINAAKVENVVESVVMAEVMAEPLINVPADDFVVS